MDASVDKSERTADYSEQDAMVKLTEQERLTVRTVWEKVNIDEIGPQVLAR